MRCRERTSSPYIRYNSKKMDIMVSRIRRTPTVGERAAAVERTNAIALEAAREERRRREEKTERLRKLRLEGAPEKPLARSWPRTPTASTIKSRTGREE